MYKKIYIISFLYLLISIFVVSCEPPPELNRPWHTATPKFASPVEQQLPTAAPSVTKSVQNSTNGAATTSKTIEIAGDEANPPFMFVDANGNTAGLYPILLEAIFQRMGMNVSIKNFPWNRAFEMGKNGEMPLAGVYKNDERMKVFDYSDAIYPNKIMIYVQKGKSFKFETPDDLAGKNIGIMRGWTYGDAFDQAKAKGLFATEEVSSDSDNLQKLVLGRLDCVLAESTIAGQIIKQNGYEDKVEMLSTPLIVFDAYLVFAKSTNQTELIKTFNETLASMKQDGSYDKLISDWNAKE